MVTVTKLEPIDQKRTAIFLDGVFVFCLYKNELKHYHITEGSSLSLDTVSEIEENIIDKRVKLRAMNLLMGHSYTEHQLAEKLLKGYYTQKQIDEAIAYLKGYHYIDDERYAKDFIFSHRLSKSKLRMKQDLLGKGVSKEVIEKCFYELEELGDAPDESEQVRKLLEKRHFDPDTADLKERQKTYAFLMRKGYSASIIKSVINTLDIV